MEKNKPHCPLSRVKALIEAGKVHMTTTARNGAAALGYDRKRAYAEIMCLSPHEFYKSMTTYHDSSVWQDVYRHKADVVKPCIMMTVVPIVLVDSFMEL